MAASEDGPIFSVCIPTYNGADYLSQAIESVLAQTFVRFELLICDDGSTDATSELVAKFRDPRIRYLSFQQNLGQSGNFNRCILQSHGELWTLLSADDRLLPAFLERAHAELARHVAAGFFVAAYKRIDERGNALGEKRAWPTERALPAGGFLGELILGAQFNTLGLVVRRSSLVQVGDFRTDVRWGHDWDWILRLVEHHGGIYIPELLAEYREHPASGTADALRAGTNGAAELRILHEALGRLPPNTAALHRRRSLRAFAIRQLFFAHTALGLGAASAALANLRHAFFATPWVLSRVTFWGLLARSAIGSLGSTARPGSPSRR